MSDEYPWEHQWHMAQLVLMRIIKQPCQTWQKRTMAIDCLYRMESDYEQHKKEMDHLFPKSNEATYKAMGATPPTKDTE